MPLRGGPTDAPTTPVAGSTSAAATPAAIPRRVSSSVSPAPSLTAGLAYYIVGQGGGPPLGHRGPLRDGGSPHTGQQLGRSQNVFRSRSCPRIDRGTRGAVPEADVSHQAHAHQPRAVPITPVKAVAGEPQVELLAFGHRRRRVHLPRSTGEVTGTVQSLLILQPAGQTVG